MKKTIKGIYREETFYIDKCGINNKKLLSFEQEAGEMEKRLQKRLKEVEGCDFDKYKSILFEIANIYNEEYFAKGFELGVKIATEVFYK